jgi:hypothetical protein
MSRRDRFYSRILRQVRRVAEGPNGDHRLVRFRPVKGCKDSKLGLEFVAWCKFCEENVIVYPQYSHEHHTYIALVSICQCGHRHRRSTFFFSREPRHGSKKAQEIRQVQ